MTKVRAIYDKKDSSVEGEERISVPFSEQEIKGYSAHQIRQLARAKAPEGYELNRIEGLNDFKGLRKRL